MYCTVWKEYRPMVWLRDLSMWHRRTSRKWSRMELNLNFFLASTMWWLSTLASSVYMNMRKHKGRKCIALYGRSIDQWFEWNQSKYVTSSNIEKMVHDGTRPRQHDLLYLDESNLISRNNINTPTYIKQNNLF